MRSGVGESKWKVQYSVHCLLRPICKYGAHQTSAWICIWCLYKVLCKNCFLNAPHQYHIRPNYCTVRIDFSKLLGTHICGKICIYLLRIHYKKDQKKSYLMMIIMQFFSDFLYKGICCGYSSELHWQVDAIQKSTHNICLCKEVEKKCTGCNLKTMGFLDCALIGVCTVIRLNTVCKNCFLSAHPYVVVIGIWYTCNALL